MKCIKLCLALAAAMTLSSQAMAKGTVTGKITRISTGTAINVYFDTAIEDGSGGGIPACSTTTSFMSLAPTKKNELAILLTAMATDKTVKVSGTNNCTTRATSEDIGQVQVFN